MYFIISFLSIFRDTLSQSQMKNISILLLCFVVAVFSQCPTFYRHVDFQGDSFSLCGDSNVDLSNWNDQVSSFDVPPGFSVRLYEHINFQGKSYGPYGMGAYNVPSEFNDQMSSARVH